MEYDVKEVLKFIDQANVIFVCINLSKNSIPLWIQISKKEIKMILTTSSVLSDAKVFVSAFTEEKILRLGV